MNELLDALPDEDTCRASFREWFTIAKMPYQFPLSEADELKLVSAAGEFEATPAVLARCESMGWFTPPDNGEWSARDMAAFAGILGAMRFWQPSPSIHDLQRGPVGIEFSNAVQSGTVRDITDSLTSKGVDLRRALLLMVHTETRAGRELLFWSVAAFLHVRGIAL
jgi:hypothetical protein